MKKKLLISCALFLSATFSAVADTYYLIKDGQLNEGVIQKPYAPAEEGAYDTIVFGQDFDGKTCAEYTHNLADYKDVRFDLSGAPLDLTKAWVMTFKYRIPGLADTTDASLNTLSALKQCSAVDGTKPAFWFGMGADPDSINLNNIDLSFNVQGAVESIENGGEWIEKKVLLTVPLGLTEIKSFVMGYAREAGDNDISGEPMYIEELSFSSEGDFPFFSEDFTPVGGSITSDGPTLNSEGTKWKSKSTFEVGKKTVSSVRLWDKPWDDSKMPASEIPHAVKVTQKMGYFTILDIALPSGAKGLYVYTLAKAQITDKDQDAWDALAETAAERPLTVSAIFDDADATVVPVYPEAIRNSKWEWNVSNIAVPEGATKVSLKFDASDCALPLLVNQVYVSEGPGVFTDVEDIASDVNGISGAEVYVADDVLYAEENATKIEVISLAGSVVASVKGNSVNVSSLAKGAYIVRVSSSNGTSVASFIKK